MKISLCKNNKNVKHTKEFLERNLRKIKIEEKGCLHNCSECKKKVIANVDGKDISGKNEYELLKEIKKILKKNDMLDLLTEEIKEKAKEVKEEKEKKDKKKSDKHSKKVSKPKAEFKGNELIITIPDEDFNLEDLKIRVISADESESMYDVILDNDSEEEEIEVKEDAEETESEKEETVSEDKKDE